MFYSEAILSKKGPLAKVWLAAHWERKLTKTQFLQTNLHNSVDAIMGADQAPMALRLSGQLLLGVARIYSRKTRYLLEDCNEAMIKIKVAFRADAINGDSNLLALDSNADAGADSRTSAAAFNAITVPDAMTEFDLLLPAQGIDISAWGLNPKLSHLSGHRDITLEEGNEDDFFSAAGNYQSLDHGRRNLDIEVGRNQMNRIGGGGGYGAMDFDLAGPDDALDLDMFGEDFIGTGDFDFLKRPHRRDDLEIEVGRDAAVSRRSASVDPFGMLTSADKQGTLHLGEGSEDGRALSVNGSIHDHPVFDDFAPLQDGARAPLHFDIAEGVENHEGQEQQENQPQQPAIKKRKLVVDEETEMSQELGMNADPVAEGLLTTHEMLPRSRKMLRLQQIEQNVARGGLAGYLLDCTAGPRVMGSALVPELASMFSRRLQIAPEVSEPGNAQDAEIHKEGSMRQQDHVESWMDQLHDNDTGFGQTTPPPEDTFDGFQLESPRKGGQAIAEIDIGEGSSTTAPKSSSKGTLFQEMEDSNTPAVTTKQLLGTVFSTSTVHAMRLVQKGLESRRNEYGGEAQQPSIRSTRTLSVATANSASNKDNSTRVTFSGLMAGPNGSQQKRNRADAAKLFFDLLVLSTKDVVKVEQQQSFGEITVGGSPWLETLVEADANTTEQQVAQ
ncbi:Rec8 like protein-domain-containing protein [Dissophora ornata]|nr:sister chromatid cohesion protein 1 [Dissophora ornata]KAI8603518.1 Rec8 like protein-domain-containing protein [Dissophora ornata]